MSKNTHKARIRIVDKILTLFAWNDRNDIERKKYILLIGITNFN